MTTFWTAFFALVFALLAFDLIMAARRQGSMGFREALAWSGFYIALALAFCGGVWAFRGAEDARLFLTGYVVELSLSVDNLFVFLVIFQFFRVPGEHQHKVLFWGILGALAMRGIFIWAGTALISRFEWLVYFLGAFLLYTAFRLVASGEEKELELGTHPMLRLASKFLPVTQEYAGGSFFTRVGGVLHATPLFVVVLVIETTDLIFAVDSIPAILGITQDTFIVYTSNVFAIIGLRALFFALRGFVGMFRFLNYGLSIVLGFIGIKMLLHHFYRISTGMSLAFVIAMLAGAVIASLMFPKPPEPGPPAMADPEA